MPTDAPKFDSPNFREWKLLYEELGRIDGELSVKFKAELEKLLARQQAERALAYAEAGGKRLAELLPIVQDEADEFWRERESASR